MHMPDFFWETIVGFSNHSSFAVKRMLNLRNKMPDSMFVGGSFRDEGPQKPFFTHEIFEFLGSRCEICGGRLVPVLRAVVVRTFDVFLFSYGWITCYIMSIYDTCMVRTVANFFFTM